MSYLQRGLADQQMTMAIRSWPDHSVVFDRPVKGFDAVFFLQADLLSETLAGQSLSRRRGIKYGSAI
jgi:hypothetical protein